jgi:transposase
MYAACKPTTTSSVEVKKERINTVGIDLGKKKCRAAVKDGTGHILGEFFFSNDKNGIKKLTKIALGYGECEAVVESTANMWIRIHDTLEDNGINTVLANPYKTRIIAEAKVKSDKLDARILTDLLRSSLVYQSYVPSKGFREKRSLIRHRISLVRNRTLLQNKVHSLLDKYDYKTELTDIFGRSGMYWLKGIELDPIDRVIMDTTLSLIENLDMQISIISRQISRYTWESEDVKLILSITEIDVFSAMLITVEIVDIRRFSTPWKLVSYAGLAPSIRESSVKVKYGKITKQGSPWLRWILVQCAMTAVRYDEHLRTFYEKLKIRKGHVKAIVATAKEILVIIWYMLTRRELYRYLNRQRYQQKLSRLKKIKEQQQQ